MNNMIHKLNESNIYIDTYLSSYNMPDPQTSINKIMKSLNILDPRDIMVIDNTTHGLKKGRLKGCWTVGVSKWSRNLLMSDKQLLRVSPEYYISKINYSRNKLLSSKADYIINSLDELPFIIKEIK